MNKIYRGIKSISDKIKAIDKKAIKVSAIVLILFLSVWIIYLFHISNNSKEYRKVVDDFIMVQTEKESDSIANRLAETTSIITYIARSASKIPDELIATEISSVAKTAMGTGYFENVVYITLDGRVYFADGSSSDEYDLSDITALVSPVIENAVFNNSNNVLASNSGYGTISPVKKHGQISGYMLGVVPYERIVQESLFRGELVHDEIILDGQGMILCQILNDNRVVTPKNKVLFFDAAQSNMAAEEFNKLAASFDECMSAKVPGKILVDTVNEKNLFIYYPIPVTDGWSVMDCYPESVIASRTRSNEIESIGVFAIIVIIMIIAAMQVVKYLSGEKKRITELEFLDGLTGVFNRNAFVAKAEEILKENKNLPYYMICFDIVNFRIINETYGHERSDVIIRELAKACGEAFGHNEVYGRLTADVFVALTLDDGEENERIEYLEQQVVAGAREVYINHPIKIKRGRYEVTDVRESINRMIDKANIARKSVNINGTDLSCQYSEELLEDARKTDEIESQMHKALENGEFKPYLQAKFNMVENHVSGAEALVRWIKSDGKIVPPGDFIPLFERNGFVEKVDFYMLEEICKYLRRMIDENREVYKVSVNQSRYLLNDPEYVSKVKAILLKYQIPVGLIELELTETVFFHEKDRMIQMMNDLKKMNVDLSIDDFGSGYSSFNILKDVPFDVLKIDREFLSDSVHTDKGRIILQKIVDMAHGLGMSVICEGVENIEQIDLLTSIDCHYAQGFYYSRPIPMEEFIEKFNPIRNTDNEQA